MKNQIKSNQTSQSCQYLRLSTHGVIESILIKLMTTKEVEILPVKVKKVLRIRMNIICNQWMITISKHYHPSWYQKWRLDH